MPKMSTVTVTVEYGRTKKASRSFVVRSDLGLDDDSERTYAGQRAAIEQVRGCFAAAYLEACTQSLLAEQRKASSDAEGLEKRG